MLQSRWCGHTILASQSRLYLQLLQSNVWPRASPCYRVTVAARQAGTASWKPEASRKLQCCSVMRAPRVMTTHGALLFVATQLEYNAPASPRTKHKVRVEACPHSTPCTSHTLQIVRRQLRKQGPACMAPPSPPTPPRIHKHAGSTCCTPPHPAHPAPCPRAQPLASSRPVARSGDRCRTPNGASTTPTPTPIPVLAPAVTALLPQPPGAGCSNHPP